MTDELELCNRRKKSALADDIYVIGYSVVNEQEHKRLKVLKSKTDAGDITLTQGEPVNPTTEDSELLVMCHLLREQVEELLGRVASLSSRVESLESELTGLKILRLDDRKRNDQEKIKPDVHEISKNIPVPIINPLMLLSKLKGILRILINVLFHMMYWKTILEKNLMTQKKNLTW